MEASSLEITFSMEEVSSTLSDLNGDKALGLDGLIVAFWQSCWDIVRDDVMRMFRDFHETGKFVRSLNATFIVMIPMKGGAEDLKDFRPISLVGSLYKLLAKVLANRLKRVMSSLVNKAQNAFVGGRQILVASLIANEVIDSMVKKNERGILCKLDIEKAYDNINWKFLFGVLQKMGFGPKWVSWIKQCVTTASFSVLVNGSPAGCFNSSRGLRQGDPLSPYLFILGMEVFSILMEKAASKGFLQGHKFVNRSGDELQLNHLLFADDTLVFCKDTRDQLAYLS